MSSTAITIGSQELPNAQLEPDKRYLLNKIIDVVAAVFWEFIETLKLAFLMLFGPQEIYRKFETKSDSQGLVVLVHGLFSHPSCWNNHLAQIDRNQYDVYTPFVTRQGNCSLEEAANPIYETIKQYYEKPENENKPLCLVGHSNGGRIIHAISQRLSQEKPKVAAKVSSIAGAHFGSHVPNFFKGVEKVFCFFDPAMIEGLSYNGVPAQELLKGMRAPLPENTLRSYSFYGTRNDLLVPLDSALPDIHKKEEHLYLSGLGHCAIVPTIAADQMKSCLGWMAEQRLQGKHI
jgi:hypothetical protein